MRVLVTGGLGFLGSHMVRALLKRDDIESVATLDCLTYAGFVENLQEALDDTRHRWWRIDLRHNNWNADIRPDDFGLVLHFAAETHVDRSLNDAGPFVSTNVNGTHNILAAMRYRQFNAPLLMISTDEVYGPAAEGVRYDEDQPVAPANPYAASKAAADLLALAYARSFGLKIVIARSVNVFGPHQHPEKAIPVFTRAARTGQKLPLYGDGHHRRCWLYVEDFVAAISSIVDRFADIETGTIFNIGSPTELENLALARRICALLGADESLIGFVDDRPGHDRRYALSWDRLAETTGWEPRHDFDESLRATIEWYKAHAGRVTTRRHLG